MKYAILILIIIGIIICDSVVFKKYDEQIYQLRAKIQALELENSKLCPCPDIAEDMSIVNFKKAMKYKTFRGYKTYK